MPNMCVAARRSNNPRLAAHTARARRPEHQHRLPSEASLKVCTTFLRHNIAIRTECRPTRKRSDLVTRKALLSAFVLPLVLAGQVQAARLTVTIDGTRSADGYLYVALFSQPDGFPDGNYSARHTKVKAATETLTAVFDDLAPGTYAVGAYHDENNNGRLDTDFIGYPREGYALSNGVRAALSRPRFTDAAFAINGKEAYVTLCIGY
jgi:uncharacterized protein (DUF2141 family)